MNFIHSAWENWKHKREWVTAGRIITAWRWCGVGDTAHNASSSPSKRDRTLTALGDLDHFTSTADLAVQRDCPLSDKNEHARFPLMTVLVIVVINLNSDQLRTEKKH